MIVSLFAGGLAARVAATAPPAPPDPAALVAALSSTDAPVAARAESRLIALGPAATAEIVRYLLDEKRDTRAVPAILRIIARVRDKAAARGLWLEWDRNPEGRDFLIEAWGSLGEDAISPLAGYFTSANTDQRERIVEVLGALGEKSVPAFRTLQTILGADPGGVSDRLLERIQVHITRAPVVTLARKGPVALRELEMLAADPSTNPAAFDAAVSGIKSIAATTDAGAEALIRIAQGPAGSGATGAAVIAAADEARLLMLSRRGEAAISDYVALAKDPSARESLRIEAINGLFGLGATALPALTQLAAVVQPGPVSDYLRDLTGSTSLKAAVAPAPVPAAPAPTPAPTSPAGKTASAPGGVPVGETCFNDAPFNVIASLPVGGLPISSRWFRTGGSGNSLLWTTIEAGFYRVVTSRADGSAQVTLAPLAHQFAPSMSWDGRRIAFLGNEAPITDPLLLNDVYIANPDGSNLRKMTTAPGLHTTPIWLVKRDEIAYAWIRLAGKATSGPEKTETMIFRHAESTGERKLIASLTDRIVTAIEPSPNFRSLAFLSYQVEGDRAGSLFAHVTDVDGNNPREILVSLSLPLTGKHAAPTIAEAIAIGGDLTWSSDSQILTAAGKILNLAEGKVEARIDPASDAYALRHASRTIFPSGSPCGFFNDTRQVVRRCPPQTSVQIIADCRGALLWHDEGRARLGLFDSLNGKFGFLQLAKPKPTRPSSERPSPAQGGSVPAPVGPWS